MVKFIVRSMPDSTDKQALITLIDDAIDHLMEANTNMANQTHKISEQMEMLLSGALDAQAEKGSVASLLELLPDEFSTADLIKLRAKKGQSVKSESIRKLLQRWKNNGRIEKIADNRWTILMKK